jgi:hypothetical protein
MCQKWVSSQGLRVTLPRYRLLWNPLQVIWRRKLNDMKRFLWSSMPFPCHYHTQLVIYDLILNSNGEHKKLTEKKKLKYWHFFFRNDKLNTFKILESSGESKDCTVQAAKRQRLEKGHLSKVLSFITHNLIAL